MRSELHYQPLDISAMLKASSVTPSEYMDRFGIVTRSTAHYQMNDYGYQKAMQALMRAFVILGITPNEAFGIRPEGVNTEVELTVGANRIVDLTTKDYVEIRINGFVVFRTPMVDSWDDLDHFDQMSVGNEGYDRNAYVTDTVIEPLPDSEQLPF